MSERIPEAEEKKFDGRQWLNFLEGRYVSDSEAEEKINGIFASFFTNGSYVDLESGQERNSGSVSADLGKGPDDIDLDIRLDPNLVEKEHLSEQERDFQLNIQIRGGKLESLPDEATVFWSDKYRLSFNDAIFMAGEKQVALNELSPGIRVEMTNKGIWSEAYNIPTHTVKASHLKDLKDVLALFHEVGHAIDDKKRGIKDWKEDEGINGGLGERNAWAEALKITRKCGVPITKDFLDDMQGYLKSHESSIGKPVSDESRRQARSKRMLG
jgi:hypothetical protein